MRLDVVVEETLPHPVEKVWSALTSAESVSAWLMATDDFRPAATTSFCSFVGNLTISAACFTLISPFSISFTSSGTPCRTTRTASVWMVLPIPYIRRTVSCCNRSASGFSFCSRSSLAAISDRVLSVRFRRMIIA